MLKNAFEAMALTSCIGSVLALVLLALSPWTHRRFSSHWHYRVWLLVLVVMVLPIRITLPQQSVTIDPLSIVEPAAGTAVGAIALPQAIQPVLSVDWTSVLAQTWLVGAFLCLAVKLTGYALFLHKVRMSRKETTCPQVPTEVRTYTCSAVASPMLVGLFRPMLLLPEKTLSAAQLSHVLAHEMTHFRRRDIWGKWFVCLVKCVHWFNPLAHFVARQANAFCEITCDAAVTASMSGEETLGYVDTVLALAASEKQTRLPLTTGMSSGKRMLKRRLVMLKNKKEISKPVKVLSVLLAAVLVLGALFASGVLADTLRGEEEQVVIENMHAKLVWPCPSSTTVSYGYDAEKMHYAIDIVAKKGAAVAAAANGTVLETGFTATRGNYILLSDGADKKMLYAHLSEVAVSQGAAVNAGQVIGKVGATGMATGPNLHFQLFEKDENVNPLNYF